MLCAMLTDERAEIRMKAVTKILLCRKTPETSLRIFHKPVINYNANEYYELISDDSIWLESILTNDITTMELEALSVDTIHIFKFKQYPSHTQAVERHIRLVSKTSENIANRQDRDGRIHVTLMERRLMPYFKSKQNFCKYISFLDY